MLGGSWVVGKKYEDFARLQTELVESFEYSPVLKPKETSIFSSSESLDSKKQNIHSFVVVQLL